MMEMLSPDLRRRSDLSSWSEFAQFIKIVALDLTKLDTRRSFLL